MRVTCCGLTTLDVVQYVTHPPGPDEKMQALAARAEFGGPAANAAFTAVVLGMPATLVSAVGAGVIGRVVAEQLRQAGVQLVDTADGDWQVPVSAITVAGDSRSVVSANAAGAPEGSFPPEALEECGALLVDGHHLGLCLSAAAAARDRGIPVLLDGGSWKPGLERLLPLVDAAVLSADFVAPHPVDWGERPVAVTRGPDPIRFRDASVPVPAVEVVDTVGAGDVLHGALLVHLARHGLGDFENGLRSAARVASESCRYAGAHGWGVTTKG